MTVSSDLGNGLPGSPDLLRAVFRQHAAGVAVITAAAEGAPAGFTATSLTSVSAEPPVVSFGIGTSASSWPAVSRAEHIGVHVLGAHQRELAATFARSGADRFGDPTRWSWGPEGVPLIADVLAYLVCRVVARVPVGNHRMVLAEAVVGQSSAAGRPLLYHQGRFGEFRA